MSFDATRAVWAARDSGALVGGPRLLVALAMADRAAKDSGNLVAGTRGLAARCGVSQPTVLDTQRQLEAAGVIERTERGIGTRPSRWRWLLAPPSTTGLPQGVDNNGQRSTSKAQGQGLALKNLGLARNHESGSAQPRKRNQDQGVNQGGGGCEQQPPEAMPAHLRDATEPDAVPLHVAALREAMGPRRNRSAHPPRPTVVAVVDGNNEGGRPAVGDDDGRPFSHEVAP